MAPPPTEESLATRPIMNRQPHSCPNNVPRSIPVEQAAMLAPDTETMTQWSAFGIFRPEPFRGGYDELSLEGRGMMANPQATLYDASPNPWPNNGQYDRPNAGMAIVRLKPHTSAHAGFAMPTGAGPTMLFRAPPVFTLQTQPVPAVGV
jgi:hypothetical protein